MAGKAGGVCGRFRIEIIEPSKNNSVITTVSILQQQNVFH